MMPAGNPYLDQFTQSLAEAAQVANQLRQAHLQQQEISNQNQQAQARQALAEQQFNQQKGEQSLADRLKMNDMGAQQVGPDGTVGAQLPNMAGVQEPASLPDALSGINGHPAFQSTVPAGYDGHVVTKMPDGTSYQLPTAEEQFARALNHSGQQLQQQFPYQYSMKTAGMIPLSAAMAEPLGLRPGMLVDPRGGAALVNAGLSQYKLNNGLNNPTEQARETMARDYFARTGQPFNAARPAWTQVAPAVQARLLGQASEATIAPSRRAQIQASTTNTRANTAMTNAQLAGAHATASGIANGLLPPDATGGGRTSPIVTGDLAKGGVDISGAKATYGADTKSLDQMTKQRDSVLAFEKTAGKNLDIFLNAASKIPDTGVPWLNAPLRNLNDKLLGSKEQAAVNVARQVAVNEIAKVTTNPTLAGTLSDSARKEVSDYNPQSATFAQTLAVAKVLKQDMANRKDALNGGIEDIQKRIKSSLKNGQSTYFRPAGNGSDSDLFNPAIVPPGASSFPPPKQRGGSPAAKDPLGIR